MRVNFSEFWPLWHFWYIFGTGSFVEVGSVWTSFVTNSTILVQLDECFQTRMMAMQCDLPFQSNESKLFWVLTPFGTFGTFLEQGHLSKSGQFERVLWPIARFWYSLTSAFKRVWWLCSAIYRSRVMRVNFSEFWPLLVLLVHFWNRVIFRSWVSSNQFGDLTHSASTVFYAL